ncbi:MAG: RNA polymerase sigma factor [Gemmatimonadaceae bacterium]
MSVPATAPGASVSPTAEEHADEPQIVARVQHGDTAAFEVLVRRYLPRAVLIARQLLRDHHDAEDLVQDAFLRALDRIHTFDARRDFGPWFFRLLVNTGLNVRRARTLRLTEREAVDVPAGDDGPDRLVERREVRERFTRAVDALPARQRLIVSLFEVHGFSGAEIAEMVGVTPATVRWHLHEARRTLRAALAPVKE